MSKRLIMLFCALFVLAMAVPAFAAVQNVKVSGDMDMRYIARDNFDLTKSGPTAGSDLGEDQIGVFNTITRLRVDADLTDNVSTVVRLINERNWNSPTTGDDSSSDIDLDLAYVAMKEFWCSPLTLTVGRQELHFGNDMIIGDSTTNQTTNYNEATGWGSVNGDLSLRKSFDAVRGTLNFDPFVLDLVFAKINAGLITGATDSDDTNLYGVNAGFKFNDKRNSLLEGYMWTKTVESSGVTGTTADKGDSVVTLGGRVSTNIVDKVNVQQELAWQGGKKVVGGIARDRSAWASQTMATVTPGWKHNPVVGMVYSFFSGESNPAFVANQSKKWHGWDPMFENQTAGSIINALFGQSQCHNIDLMAKLSPEFLKDVTIRGDWVFQSLAKGLSSNVNGAANDYSAGYVYQANKKYLGQELDLTVMYDYTEDVQFSLLTGIFLPGKSNALNKAQTNGDIANAVQAIVGCKVSF